MMIPFSTFTKKINNIILFIFLFTTLSGAVRKWIVESSAVSNAILGVQLLLPFLFLLLPSNKENDLPKKLLISYVLILVPMMFNPLNQTYFHGIFGFMLHLAIWIPMFYYFSNRSYFSIDTLIPIFIIVTFAEVSLGMVQYGLPFEHVLNRYVDQSKINYAAQVGDSIRVTGSFSFIGGFASFMFFVACLIHGMIIKRANNILITALLIFGFMGAFMSGFRVIVALFTMIVFSGFVFSGRIIYQTKFLVKGVLILFSVIFINFAIGNPTNIGSTFIRSYENFMDRVEITTTRGETQSRLKNPLYDVVNFRGEYWLFGVGLGSTYQGSNTIWGESQYLKPYGWYEEEPERIVLEGGFILFIVRIALFIMLGYFLRIPLILKIPLLILIFIFLPVVFNTFNAVYIFLGLILMDQIYTNRDKSLTLNVS